MLVTFISQCEKKALNRTRRILDAFANRIGDNVWQTAITEDGLDTVKKLLKASATKSTAVSCHRVRTRQRTELVWVVGKRDKFNEQGLVAVNRTKRNILHSEWENNWHFLQGLQLMATLAGLLHDIGKSSDGFQYKLHHRTPMGDPYRHEWVSLQLLGYLLTDCKTDKAVFERLQHLSEYLTENPLESYLFDDKKIQKSHINHLPPLSQWLAWLVVTHHRLPPLDKYYFEIYTKHPEKTPKDFFTLNLKVYYSELNAYQQWVKNARSLEEMDKAKQATFWQFENCVVYSPTWQKQVKRYAKKVTENMYLMGLSESAQKTAITDPFLLHLSRLSLMVGDHNYSSLKSDSKQKVQGDKDWREKLIANTDRTTGKTNQALDEHLLGVGQFTAQFCRALPILHEQLPKLIDHNPLIKNTAHPNFAWQNKAFKLALSQHENSETHGFFGVNMASTGGVKTIGNARIMYALANPKKGARLTIALGLRVLTLQTGKSFRDNLSLTDKDLTILVGGQAQKQLFEMSEQEKADTNNLANYGSESAENLVDELVDGDIDDNLAIFDELKLGTVIADETAKKLIFAPIVTCTIDHLMGACESKRGGKYIAPMLRLFSSDLIFDEPDDFDQSDLPALSRLVHLAGVFGSRVLLSSATLPPDMLAGLYQAYLAGRSIYNAQFGLSTPNVVCAWFDENDCIAKPISQADDYMAEHDKFVSKRVKFLASLPVRRFGEIMPINANYHHEKQAQFYGEIAKRFFEQAVQLHERHHLTNEQGQSVSIGLIRLANIAPLMQIVQAMHQADSTQGLQDYQFYVACYHSQQVLALRSRLEQRLDSLLKRDSDNPTAILQQADISKAIRQHSDKTQHIFIVLATPVAEVGRDHDYDWAIVEPSSMRSIIQLAGRVWRHRADKVADTPNIAIMQYNIKALKKPNHAVGDAIFTHPGFESEKFLLTTHDTSELIAPTVLQKIDAVPRISKSSDPLSNTSLADLEQAVMADLMNNTKPNVVNSYWQNSQTSNRSHVLLSCLTPFRAGEKQLDYVIRPHYDDPQQLEVYLADDVKEKGFREAGMQNAMITPRQIDTSNPQVTPWLTSCLGDELAVLQSYYPQYSRNTLVLWFCGMTLPERKQSTTWYFDERFGCWQKD
ncbi:MULTISPECIES: type I-F CRISPR-associated helicase Cas3f [unclassified Moraxella]|uniref:type I-F CRISPR-associated helicase Cas3f n=1 Tax=unclassified Moraxella TaxID=2685852 RepID=UPI003AF42A6B